MVITNSANTVQCQVRGCRGEAPARVNKHCCVSRLGQVRFGFGLGLGQVRFGLGQIWVRLGLGQIRVWVRFGLLLNNRVTLFITIKKVSPIHQKCPQKFTKKMSMKIHPFCARKFAFYVQRSLPPVSFHCGGLKLLFTIFKLSVLCGGDGGTAARHQPHAASRTSNSLGMSNATSKAMQPISTLNHFQLEMMSKYYLFVLSSLKKIILRYVFISWMMEEAIKLFKDFLSPILKKHVLVLLVR